MSRSSSQWGSVKTNLDVEAMILTVRGKSYRFELPIEHAECYEFYGSVVCPGYNQSIWFTGSVERTIQFRFMADCDSRKADEWPKHITIQVWAIDTGASFKQFGVEYSTLQLEPTKGGFIVTISTLERRRLECLKVTYRIETWGPPPVGYEPGALTKGARGDK